MSLSQDDRDQRDLQMFGMLTADLRELAETSVYRFANTVGATPTTRLDGFSDLRGDVMLAISMMSDAQECLPHDTKLAQQYVNRAKYILNYFVLDRE